MEAEETRASPTDRRFRRDVIWNLASLAFLAVAGVGINLLIAATGGPDALGVFQQVFAVFVIASQLAVFGVHVSVLRSVSVGVDAGEDGNEDIGAEAGEAGVELPTPEVGEGREPVHKRDRLHEGICHQIQRRIC